MKYSRGKRPKTTPVDPAKMQRATGYPDRRQIEMGTVGFDSDQAEWPEDTPAWIRWEQGEALIEVTLRDGDKITARWGVSSTEPISYGQQVVVALADGDPGLAVIVGVLSDARFREPGSVCGVDTGAAQAQARGEIQPAATWQFMRLANGRMLGVQTQGADVSIWSGGSVHIRCSTLNAAGAPDGAIHLDGRVSLGGRPLKDPMGSAVAPGGEEIPGVLATPDAPAPYTPPGAQPPAAISYVGKADGIVRAKELYQSNATIDPVFWAWISAIDAEARTLNPTIPLLPTNQYSAISGAVGPGSKHTASD